MNLRLWGGAFLISSLIGLSSCGGGSVEGRLQVSGIVKASYVEGIKVCLYKTSYCSFTDKNGFFSIYSPLHSKDLVFYLNSSNGDIIWGTYRLKTNGEIITPLKVANYNATLAKYLGAVLHALDNDTSGTAEYLSLRDKEIVAIQDGNGNNLKIDNLEAFLSNTTSSIIIKYKDESNTEKEIKIDVQNITVSLCDNSTCIPVQYEPYKWIIVILYDGDNNLDDYVDKDIQELQKVSIPSNIKVIGLADYKYQNGGFIYESNETTGKYELVKEIAEPDMGNAEYLANFLVKVFQEYPSQYKTLIMWNHGYAWKVPTTQSTNQVKLMAVDDTNGDYLYSYKFVQMLETLKKEGITLNVIGFDECLMGNTEVFWDIANYTEYSVGSELLEPATGWDYNILFTKLAKNPYATPQQFAQYIVDSYAEAYSNYSDITMLAASSKEIKNLVNDLNNLANKFNPDDANVVNIFQTARENAYNINVQGDYAQNHQLIDLYTFAVALQDYYPEAKNIVTTINGMYKKIVGNNEVKGLSIFFPIDKNSDDLDYYCSSSLECAGYYNPFTVNQWDEFLREYLNSTSN